MIPAYAELHCVSNFSFLRGASHPEELVDRACELGGVHPSGHGDSAAAEPSGEGVEDPAEFGDRLGEVLGLGALGVEGH